jgi:hypothetical protein
MEDDLALATFILAGATGLLALFVLWQVILQRKQLAASDRPCVYPITPHTCYRRRTSATVAASSRSATAERGSLYEKRGVID